MPDKPPKLPPLGFAGFEDSPAAGGRRRKATWSLRPMQVPQDSQATDAARRFVNEAELMQGLGRRKEE
jgi:hypothetical protein